MVAEAEPYAQGEAALAAGNWPAVRDAFACGNARDPRVLDALARSFWWMGDFDGAIDARRRAYAGFRSAGETTRAVRAALWLAHEYLAVKRNASAARGWIARAERLLGDDESAEHGWLALLLSRRADDPHFAEAQADRALGVVLRFGDRDLELRALARKGLCHVVQGRIDERMAALDEAMAGATAGEPANLEVTGEVSCDLVRAAKLIREMERFGQWGDVVMRFVEQRGYMPLVAFCASCCGELPVGEGSWSEAERQLVDGLAALEATGHQARCVHPAAQLASLRTLQGGWKRPRRSCGRTSSCRNRPCPQRASRSFRAGPRSRSRGFSDGSRCWATTPCSAFRCSPC